MRRLAGIFAVSVLTSALLFGGHQATANQVRKPSVRTFDILGIRLYEPAESAIAKLQHLDPQDTDVPSQAPNSVSMQYTPCAPERRDGNVVEAKQCPSMAVVLTQKYEIGVSFVEDLPHHPGKMKVYSIHFESVNRGGGSIDLVPLALRKYGTPVRNHMSHLEYCDYPEHDSSGAHCSTDHVALMLNGDQMVLSDPQYFEDELQENARYKRSLQDNSLKI